MEQAQQHGWPRSLYESVQAGPAVIPPSSSEEVQNFTQGRQEEVPEDRDYWDDRPWITFAELTALVRLA